MFIPSLIRAVLWILLSLAVFAASWFGANELLVTVLETSKLKALVGSAAIVVVVFLLALALTRRPDEPTADYWCLALACLAGVIGMAMVAAESFTKCELDSEELLLGSSGLSMLIEEYRLLRRGRGEGNHRLEPPSGSG